MRKRDRRRTRTFAFLTVLVAIPVAAAGLKVRETQVKPAEPLNPVDAIIGACRSHEIVSLGEAHDNEQEQAVRVSLVRDPRFPQYVNDIVVEFGNALFQDTIDRFMRGEDVPESDLRSVWQNTTQHAVWDSPVYEEFFRAVRTVNRSLSSTRQIRVLLGDPPIDWKTVQSPQDHWKWMLQRETFPAQLIEREVIQKHHHALVIYGDSHLQRHPIETNYSESANPRFNTLISLLEQSSPKPSLFSILVPTTVDVSTIQPSVKSWTPPRLALTRDTALGAADYVSYFKNPPDRRTVRDGALESVDRDHWRQLPMASEFDAILYLGPPESLTTRGLPPALCHDAAYMQMRESRFRVVNAKQGFEAFKAACANVK